MGFSISWVAVKQQAPEAVLQALGLSRTGQFGEFAEYAAMGRVLPSGWFLIVLDRCDHALLQAEQLASLSADCEVIACSIEEHVMFTSSECWRSGERIWRIEHDAQRGILDLRAAGTLPGNYSALAKQFAQEQQRDGGAESDVDYYSEIPLQMANSIVGFKHDEVHPEIEDGSFEVFASRAPQPKQSPPTQKKWWRFWQ
jgi:hypothetical protein